jgi:uncharacterized protein (DUF1015 family)
MNTPQAQRTATAFEPSSGVTTRPPRALITNRGWLETDAKPLDPTLVRQILDAGGYTRIPAPAVVVYRLEADQHRQTGVVVEMSMDDYRNGRILRHEATQSDRVRQLEQFTETANIEQMPVMLAHHNRARLRTLLSEIAVNEPDVRLTINGTTHTLWIRNDPNRARLLHDEISRIPTLYIADGHHRMVAAERCANRRSHLGKEHPSAFTLAALFPSTEMRVMGYHRHFRLPEGTSTSDVLALLAAQPVTARVEECRAPDEACPEPGVIVVHLDGRIYRLRLRTPHEPRHVRASLDVVALDEELLPPVFGLSRTDSGSNACNRATQGTICFLPHPPSIEQIMAVADAGLVMPPKSTWFDPKASAGLFLRPLSHGW